MSKYNCHPIKGWFYNSIKTATGFVGSHLFYRTQCLLQITIPLAFRYLHFLLMFLTLGNGAEIRFKNVLLCLIFKYDGTLLYVWEQLWDWRSSAGSVWMLHTEDIYQVLSLCVWFCSEGCMELMLDLGHPSLQLQYLTLTCLPLSIPSNNLLGSITHSSVFPGPRAFRFLGYLVVNHYSCCYHFIVIITIIRQHILNFIYARLAHITEKALFLLLKEDEMAI